MKDVRGLLFASAVFAVLACAKKEERPLLVGPTYERLWNEGWKAYRQGNYALAEEKFDTILTLVTTADPYAHVAKAFAALPQGKISTAESEVGIAISLIGNDAFHSEENKPLVNVVSLSNDSLVVRADFGEPVVGFLSGVSFGISDYDTTYKGWKVSLRLGPGHTDTFAILNGFIPFGFQGTNGSVFLWELGDSSVVLMYPDSVGAPISSDSLPVVNVLSGPDTVVDTVYYVPGDTIVLETTLVFRDTLYMPKGLGPVFEGDTLLASFLVRSADVAPDTVQVLAYLLRSAAELIKAASDGNVWPRVAAYARAAETLIKEMGLQDFAWDPLGDGTLASHFSLRRARLLQARAFWMMFLYKNAAQKVNEVYGSVQIPPDTTFTPEVIQQLALLIEQAETW